MFGTNKLDGGRRRAARHAHVEGLESRVLLSATSTVQMPLFAKEAPLAITGTPEGLSPAMIEQAYDLTNVIFTAGGHSISANGAGETIAIVDAFADPNITSDLQTFDANFGISNDNAEGQFALTVVTPQGAVATNAGWATEESLDVEWAHAIAPGASILLVEASSATVSSLTSAVTWAASQTGVVAVSMSWGDSPEFSGETSYDHVFTTPALHAGVTFVASSGDNGTPNYPSTSPNVLAVGGTTLNVDASGNWISESPWVDSGGGTSPYEGTTKPDVAYDGDPSTGFLVYDSLLYRGNVGWQVVGGTSAGTPQWAAIVAITDEGRSVLGLGSLDGPTQTIPDIHALPASDFNTITGVGLTGLGSPIGVKVISALVSGGITSVSDSAPGTAAQLAFDQEPTNVLTGSVITPPITVLVEDSSGDVVTTDNSDVTISVAGGPGSLGGTLAVQAVSGVATFSDLTLSAPGSYTLAASDGSITGVNSTSFTVTAPHLVFTQEPTNVLTGFTISPAIQVAVEDPSNTVVTGDSSMITLSIASGPAGAVLGGTLSVSAVNGVATFDDITLSEAGAYTLAASDGPDTGATSTSFTVTAPHLVFTQEPTNVLTGFTISPAIQVAVEDPSNTVVTGDSSMITLSIASGPVGAVLGGTLSVSAVNGVATFGDITLNEPGTYTLTASDGSDTGATSTSFTVVTAHLAFVQEPSNGALGIPISPAILVAVEDSGNNVVTADSSTITLGIASGPAGAVLGGTLSVTVVNGVATFSDITLNEASTYTLTASDGSYTGTTSTSFTITTPHLAFTQQPVNVFAGLATSPAIRVAVVNVSGSLVSGDSSTITLSLASGPTGATVGGTLSVAAVNGVATFTDITFDTPGNYVLSASDGSYIGASTNAFTVAVPGWIDTANMNVISGWAYDPTQTTSSASVEIAISGGPTQTFSADQTRSDLQNLVGSTNHGFTYASPVLSVGSHTAYIYLIESNNTKILLATKTLVSQNSLFDEHYYLQMNPDVAAAVAAGKIATGYDHYILYGQYEGRSPSPYWDEAYYLQVNPDVAAAVKAGTVSSGFMHYYLYGQYENRGGLLYFNTSYYLDNNPDVATAITAGTVTSAFEHFVLYGQYEGRAPMLYFSSSIYDAVNSDILPFVTGEPCSSDFEQFVEYGQYEGRIASDFYNEQIYLADNPDVAAAVNSGEFADGFQHWLMYGQYEGRTAV